jgi:4-amino-4-deoxy-L-arabinose transferase-like glycosyltransferase
VVSPVIAPLPHDFVDTQQRHDVWPWVAATAVATLTIAVGLGDVTLWEPDEPRFAEATRQMFQRGDFLTPYFNGVPRFEKPILLYWLQAVAVAVLGPTELAARLPAALAGIGCVLLLYAIGRSVTSERAALVAALVLATTFRFVTYARLGLTDTPVLFFIVATLYGFVRASSPGSGMAPPLLAWACVGLGVLTKGPIGLLPVVIWAAYALVARDWSLIIRTRPFQGAALAAAIALPWYVAMILWYGRAFVDFALGHEIAARALSESFDSPVRGLFYYVKVWPGDTAPWSALVVAAVSWLGFRWRRLDPATRDASRFALTWFATVFAVFTLSRTKVPHYVLPAYPAAALLVGVFVDRLTGVVSDRVWWRVPMAVIATVTVVAGVLSALFVAAVLPDRSVLVALSVPAVLCGGGGALGWAVWRQTLLRATSVLAGTLAAAFALIAVVIVPAVDGLKPMPFLGREASRLAPPGAAIGLLGRYGAPSLIYYSGHNARSLDDDAAVVSFMDADPRAVCVMPLTDFTRLAARLDAGVQPIAAAEEFNIRLERVLERRRAPGRVWVLVSNTRIHRGP